MGERREQPAPAGRWPAIAAATRLSPVQEAYAEYVRHAIRCEACRDIDRTCLAGEALHKGWRVQADAAFDRLAGETPSPHGQ